MFINRSNNFGSISIQKLFVYTNKYQIPKSLDIKTGFLISPIRNKEIMQTNKSNDRMNFYELESFEGARTYFNNIAPSSDLLLYLAIESLRDPRPLVKELRRYLIMNKTIARIFYYEASTNQESVYRTYGKQEIRELFAGCGFRIDGRSSKFFTVSCNEKYYAEFLKSNNMPEQELQYLFVTTEHPDYRITGGIGSYIKEASGYYGKKAGILVVDDNLNYDDSMVIKNGWFSLQNILGVEGFDYYQRNDHGATGDAITEAILSILVFYDLTAIEGSDYGGMTLFRQIQAKKSGILPANINLVTVCHGSSLYTANGAGGVVAPHALPLFFREAYSIIESDYTVFLTRFMEDLYSTHGIYANSPLYERLPFNYEVIPFENNNFSSCKNVIYIGKPTKTKGFDVFLKSVLRLKEIYSKPLNIKCYTTFTEIPEPDVRVLYDQVRAEYNVELISLKREDLLKELSVRSSDSIGVVSYPADNHPNVILELTATGMDFIATNTGGIPELVGEEYAGDFLVENNPTVLAEKINQVVHGRKKRQGLVVEHRKDFLKKQVRINNDYKTGRLINLEQKSNKNEIVIEDSVDVIIPCYNTDLKQLREALNSVQNQSVLPNKTYIINDGSTAKDYLVSLKRIAKDFKSIHAEVIDKKNGGLADARNAGLKKSEANFVVTLDSDDIVSNYYIEYLLKALKLNPDSIGATPYLSDFKDKVANPQEFNVDAYEYHPTGNFVSMSFLPSNFFGSAAGMFRRERLLKLTGGWDNTDKSMWEDWALYTKLKCLGEQIEIVPQNLYFYRVRSDSMVRTYSKDDGVKRLLRNYDAMPTLDAYVLYAQHKYIDDIQNGRYPLEIWNPIYEHSKQETIKNLQTENKNNVKKAYHKARRAGSKIKSKVKFYEQ